MHSPPGPEPPGRENPISNVTPHRNLVLCQVNGVAGKPRICALRLGAKARGSEPESMRWVLIRCRNGIRPVVSGSTRIHLRSLPAARRPGGQGNGGRTETGTKNRDAISCCGMNNCPRPGFILKLFLKKRLIPRYLFRPGSLLIYREQVTRVDKAAVESALTIILGFHRAMVLKSTRRTAP